MRRINMRGATMVELLLYIFIASTLLLSAASFTSTSFRARVRSEVAAEVEQQGRFVMESIIRSVESASSISSPTSGSSNNLSVMVPSNASPTVYSLNGSILQISENGQPAQNLHDDSVEVTSIVFTNLSRPNTPGVVRIQLTLGYNNQGDRAEFNYTRPFTTTVGVRR